MTTSLNVRIDSDTKKEAAEILDDLGLTISQAISAYFKQIILTKGIPFEIKMPNRQTIETFRKTNAGKDLHRVSNVKELMKELKS
jgi:DNA-damage-inducible protein J